MAGFSAEDEIKAWFSFGGFGKKNWSPSSFLSLAEFGFCRTEVSGFLLSISWGTPQLLDDTYIPCHMASLKWHDEFFSCCRSLTSHLRPARENSLLFKASPDQVRPTLDHLSTLKSSDLGPYLHLQNLLCHIMGYNHRVHIFIVFTDSAHMQAITQK